MKKDDSYVEHVKKVHHFADCSVLKIALPGNLSNASYFCFHVSMH